jgi:hypothetical protein
MRQFGLAPVTILTLLLTGLLLPASGWFTERTSASPTTSQCRTQARQQDLSSDAAWRYRRGQPHHWRAMVLYR